METILSELVSRLHKTYGERLISVVLYGSAAVPDGKDRFSDFNILCVLSEITPTELELAEPTFGWWRRKENPSPLLLSEDELQASSDCFPIEFHDIKERHQVLHGKDLVAGLEVRDIHYRTEVEYELRSKLLRLRQKAGEVLSEKDLLLRLMTESVSTFCVLFRHSLRLAGEESKFDKREVIEAAQNRFGIDPGPFLALINLREGRVKANQLQPSQLFREYLKQIQAVVNAVDRMGR
ncbi:MAG: hypothetical protein ACRD7E_00945 [Bryobacteraceae bacterium]